MKVRVDKEENALYFRLNESAIVESEEVRPGVILDFDSSGTVVGVEFFWDKRASFIEAQK